MILKFVYPNKDNKENCWRGIQIKYPKMNVYASSQNEYLDLEADKYDI